MSEIRTFFRHCPQCGRRFEIRLVSKKLVDDRDIQESQMPLMGTYRGGPGTYSGGPLMTPYADPHGTGRFVNLASPTPVTVELKEFDYNYRCMHCGHMWSEIKEEGEKRHEPSEYSEYRED